MCKATVFPENPIDVAFHHLSAAEIEAVEDLKTPPVAGSSGKIYRHATRTFLLRQFDHQLLAFSRCQKFSFHGVFTISSSTSSISAAVVIVEKNPCKNMSSKGFASNLQTLITSTTKAKVKYGS